MVYETVNVLLVVLANVAVVACAKRVATLEAEVLNTPNSPNVPVFPSLVAHDAAHTQFGADDPELSVSVMFVLRETSELSKVSEVVGAVVEVPMAMAEMICEETFADCEDMMCFKTQERPAVTTVLSEYSGVSHKGLPSESPNMKENRPLRMLRSVAPRIWMGWARGLRVFGERKSVLPKSHLPEDCVPEDFALLDLATTIELILAFSSAHRFLKQRWERESDGKIGLPQNAQAREATAPSFIVKRSRGPPITEN